MVTGQFALATCDLNAIPFQFWPNTKWQGTHFVKNSPKRRQMKAKQKGETKTAEIKRKGSQKKGRGRKPQSRPLSITRTAGHGGRTQKQKNIIFVITRLLHFLSDKPDLNLYCCSWWRADVNGSLSAFEQ